MGNFKKIQLVIFIVMVFSNSYCQTQSKPLPIIIENSKSRYSLDKHIQYFIDYSKKLTINDMHSPEIQKAFRDLPAGSPNLGFPGGCCWIRFELQCNANAARWLLETHFANTHYLELYLPKSQNNFAVKKSGILESTKERFYHTPVFKLDLTRGDKKIFFMRLESSASVILSFTIWSLEEFIEKSQEQRLFLGIFYGAMGIMALYGLFLLILLQEKNYIYFFMLVTSFLTLLLTYDGIFAQYLTTPAWSYWLTPSTFIAFHIFVIQFTIRVLNTKKRHPKLYKIINCTFIIWTAWLIAFPILGYLIIMRVAMFLSAITLSLVCIIGFIDTWQKYQPAYYFSFSWSFFLLTFTNEVLVHAGVIGHHPITLYAYRIGIVVLILFLSISLANYIYLLREEKETIIKEQNTLLEVKVKERSADLIKAKEHAEKANQVKGEFLSMMSHEIRTPLNGVVGAIVLLEKTKYLPEQREYLQILYESKNHLLDVVNNILDYSKLESDKVELVANELDIKECVQNLIKIFNYQAQQKNVLLKCTLDQKIPNFVVTSEQYFKQVMYNLIANAIKFTDTGQIELRIKVVEQHENQVKLLIEVEDSGIGIPPEKMHLLFNPFSQIYSSIGERQDGSGLGLAISQKLVSLMGGKIDVYSVEGRGTKFYFKLDFEICNKAIPTKNHDDVNLEFFAKKWPLNILVAEDNRVNQVIILHMLKKFGYDISIVKNGKEVIEYLQQFPCDLIFMDGQMPNMDGITTTKFIHQNFPKEKQPIIIAVTGDALAIHKKKYIEAGMQGFISKPMCLETIKKALDTWAPIVNGKAHNASDC